jgi:type IV secretion system protein VirB10
MKSKFTNKPEYDAEEDDVDVESSGPNIAAAKKSKVTIIAASSILITVVLYLLFFKSDDKNAEKLEEVSNPKPSVVAPNEDGKSPFEIEEDIISEDKNLDALSKPAVPEVPSLPDLPEDKRPSSLLLVKDTEPQKEVQPIAISPPPAVSIDAPNPQQNLGKPIDTQSAPKDEVSAIKKESNPRYAPIIVFGGAAVDGGSPSQGVGYENNIVNLSQDPIDLLERTKSGVVATYIGDRTHTIAQGKLLTAVLETAINTEIPGSVRGIVSRDVYGESGNEVLIPRGSRLYGSYSSKVLQGQGRVEINWVRLIRSDGVDLAISFNASDQFGRSGIPGDVDSKYGSIIASSMLTSILAVGGVAAAQKLLDDDVDNTTTTNVAQGTITSTGSATNQAIYDVSKTITDTVGQVVANTINVTPVIRIPQGTRVTVIVNADIIVPSLSKK